MYKKRAVRKVFSSLKFWLVALVTAFTGLYLSIAPSVNNRTRAQAEEVTTLTLTVNYYRPQADYTDWNMWLWVSGKDGKSYAFDKDATCTMTGSKPWKALTATLTGISPTADECVGLIVRKGDWAAKDVDSDRYIKGSKLVKTGDKAYECSIWLVSGDSSIYYSEDEVIVGNKITSAKFTGFKSVCVNTSAEIGKTSIFKVKDSAENVVGSVDCSADGKNGGRSVVVKLDEEIDPLETYTVFDEPNGEFDVNANFVKHVVTLDELYRSSAFKKRYGYSGTLGVEYTAEKSKFTVWAPFASDMTLNIYNTGDVTNELTATTHKMTAGTKGEWSVEVAGDLSGKYYTYTVTNGTKTTEVVDPYAKSAGQNGKRGMIVDFSSAAATPDGWADQKNPELSSYSRAVIYEAHLRDLTISPTSGVSEQNRGKFMGLTETGTKVNGSADGSPTCLDYLKSLGVTQVHFQPLFDFASVNEYTGNATYQASYTAGNGQFNWGYDPLNYNVPEGSYSSDPTDGYTRVKEMRAMVEALHNAGIQVVMDVVYNHVADAKGSNFEALVPGYYFRTNSEGGLSNGSGCGNETASERYMFRRFMIDSVKHWTKEYKIDGFRFDLMAVHDTETMNEIVKELKAINPDVLVYGEGWTGGDSGLDESVYKPAKLANAEETPDIAYFDDIVRDGLKGSVFGITDCGYVSGISSGETNIYVGAAGATAHKDVDYSAISKEPFAISPTQNINYVSAHDNSTLWDKLNASVKSDAATIKSMYRMAATAVLTGQGASFFLAGEEMLRSKPTKATKVTNKDGSHYYTDSAYDGRPQEWMTDPTYIFSDNSYKSPDSVNAINWELIDTNKDMVDFYRELIAIKKTFPQFGLTTAKDLNKNLMIRDDDPLDGVTSYAIKDPASDEYVVVLFNNKAEAKKVTIPNGKYDVHVNGDKAKAAEAIETFTGNEFSVGACSAVVLKGKLDASEVSAWRGTQNNNSNEPGYIKPDGKKTNLGLALGLGIGIPALVLIAGGTVFGVVYSEKKKAKKADKLEPEKSSTEAPESEEKSEKEERDEAPESEQKEETEAPTEPADENAETQEEKGEPTEPAGENVETQEEKPEDKKDE